MRSALWLVVLMGASVVCGATVPESNGPTIPPPKPEHPFGALETRPLWDRPVVGPSMPDRLEPELNRGNGRVEDATTFELKQIRRQQIDPSGNWAAVKEQERQEDLEAIRLRNVSDANRVKRYEREDEVLAQVRRDWSSIVQRENAAGGAVVDRMALDRMEADYRSAIDAAVKQRDAALTQLAGAQRAPGDDAKRAEILRTYEAAREVAAQAREARREVILGHK